MLNAQSRHMFREEPEEELMPSSVIRRRACFNAFVPSEHYQHFKEVAQEIINSHKAPMHEVEKYRVYSIVRDVLNTLFMNVEGEAELFRKENRV